MYLMKTFIATQHDNRGKIATTLKMYQVERGEVEYRFYFKMAEEVGFRTSGKFAELNDLIDNAINEDPQERHFEYTGSHFVPLLDRSWTELIYVV